jgi:cell division protein ZapA
MSELIPINILIADRTYRVKVAPRDEEAVRKTLKIINDKILEFRTQFAGKDMQDFLAMVILWYATQERPSEKAIALESWTESLVKIESLLDKGLDQS